MIKEYGPSVRRRSEPSPKGGSDLVIEVREKLTSSTNSWPFPAHRWVEKWRTNDMSNDFAHTEADSHGMFYRRTLMEGERC